jgi:hypothetical protein
MIIDLTAQFTPLIWGLLCVLMLLSGAILASVDPEVAEIYFGDRRLLFATAALAVVALAALVAARPEIAAAFGLPVP